MDSIRKKELEMTLKPSSNGGIKGSINKNYSSGGEEKYKEWIESVDKALGHLRRRPREASTYRVPSKLRAMKPEAYTPQMVTIGPFHRDTAELRAMEGLKWIYMLAFVDKVVIADMENSQANEPGTSQSPQMLALHKCSKVLSEVEEEARAWYAGNINLDKHQFVEMLLVDGCFILELLYRCKMINTRKFEHEYLHGPPENRVPFESLAGNFTMVQTLKHDLMLLENQIPYFVLQKLFGLISTSKTALNGVYPDMSLEDYVFWFFDSIPMLRYNSTNGFKNKGDCTYNHLLDMLYHVCKFTFVEKFAPKNVFNTWGFTRSATELFKSGFQFVRGYHSTIVDIKFLDGKIFIPQVIIDKSSDTVFRNLIALEQISVRRHVVTSYVKLMSSLILSPEDADLLDRLNIIKKSDDVEDIEDISTFFKSLCSQVDLVDFCYTDLCNEVGNHIIPFWRWHRVKGYLSISYIEWKASVKDLKRDYFKNKWSYIAFFAASFVIILGIAQTFYAIRAYYPPYH